MLIDHVKKTFADRCRKNPAYSLRAFSRSLGMDSSTLSALLNGKRPLTIKTALKIVDGLHITNAVEAQTLLIESFTGDKAEPVPGYTELGMQAAETTASWEYFAILALLQLKGFKGQDRLISERLNIPLGVVWECLDRLEKLKMIRKGKIGWELTGEHLATPSDIPSHALREGLRQNIQKAIESLELDPVDVRDVSGMTMAISKARLPEAKIMIQKFRRRLTSFLEENPRDAVYRLNIQLVPLTREKKK